MSSETAVKFVVYNIRSYFWKQPKGLKCCPVCGKSISAAEIPPSMAVASALELGKGSIPAHYFSYFYKCQACPWWGIRESWAFLEARGTNDYLIVEQENQIERRASQVPPWEQILEDLNIYEHTQPLPENLGKLFTGGVSYTRFESVRKSLWNNVKEFANSYAKSRAQKK